MAITDLIGGSDRLGSSSRRNNAWWLHLDVVLLGLTAALAGLGLLMVSSATFAGLERRGLDPHLYLKKQLLFMTVGTVLMWAVASIDYRAYCDRAALLYGCAIAGLLAVLVLGSDINGARAWFVLGPFSLQPSEFTKLVVIICLAAYGSAQRMHLDASRFVKMLGIAAVPVGLIYLEPDLGTALVYLAIVLAMLWVAGAKGSHIVGLLVTGIGVVAAALKAGLLDPYQIDRLLTFIHPDKNTRGTAFNLHQAVQAIGSGGVRGKGLYGGALTTLSYVPEQRTDFIFTAVGEQLGFVGTATFVCLFGLVCWRIMRVASSARDGAGTLICIGVLAMLVFQVFENMGMTMGIMPITGIPLPFLSYGGSSVLTCFAGIGLVLNVGKHRYE